MKKRIFWILVYVLLTLFIFSRSLKTASVSTAESRGIVNGVEKIVKCFLNSNSHNLHENITIIVRKAAHIIEFAMLSCVACKIGFVFEKKLKRFIAWVFLSGVITACVDETLQLTSDGRAGLVSDVFIDVVGTIAGVVVAQLLVRLTDKFMRKA